MEPGGCALSLQLWARGRWHGLCARTPPCGAQRREGPVMQGGATSLNNQQSSGTEQQN